MPAPIVESKRSERPLFEQTLRSPARAFILFSNEPSIFFIGQEGAATSISMCFSAPFELRNSRLISQIALPFQNIVSLFSALTFATTVALRFSSFASARKRSTSLLSTTTAILSWLSLIASSVPSRPSYFLGTALRSISRPSASSPIATETPPAPKSLQRLIIRQASPFLKSL